MKHKICVLVCELAVQQESAIISDFNHCEVSLTPWHKHKWYSRRGQYMHVYTLVEKPWCKDMSSKLGLNKKNQPVLRVSPMWLTQIRRHGPPSLAVSGVALAACASETWRKRAMNPGTMVWFCPQCRIGICLNVFFLQWILDLSYSAIIVGCQSGDSPKWRHEPSNIHLPCKKC